MSTTKVGILATVAVAAVVLTGCSVVATTPVNHLSTDDQAAGWRLLFDGSSLRGWRGYRGQPVRTWTIVDGVLARTETPAQDVPRGFKMIDGVLSPVDKAGDIVTEEEFGDFELVLDWRISPGGNSGILYRVGEADDAPWTTGLEYQVTDEPRPADGGRGRGSGSRNRAGALYDMYPPSKAAARPAGQWNRARIVVRGGHVEHWLNDEKIVDADIGGDDWKARVAAGKWAKYPSYGTLPRGRISLQDHGNGVGFRNIKIRVLEKTSAGS